MDSFFLHEQFSNGLLFDYKSYNLNSAQKCIISNTLLDVMQNWQMLVFELIGNSSVDELDSTGKLSLNRATSIKNFLVSKGINPKRIIVIGNGINNSFNESHPMDKCSFLRKNRIVSIKVSSKRFLVK